MKGLPPRLQGAPTRSVAMPFDCRIEVRIGSATLYAPIDPASPEIHFESLDLAPRGVDNGTSERSVTLTAHSRSKLGPLLELDISPAAARVIAMQLIAAADDLEPSAARAVS